MCELFAITETIKLIEYFDSFCSGYNKLIVMRKIMEYIQLASNFT